MIEIRNLVSALGLEPQTCTVLSSGGSRIDFDYEISPYEFLSQAAADLHAGGTSALLNSLTNSRRAILCQMDRILEALGFDARAMSTKAKAELLIFLGLPTPAILRKVGDLRNDLEHRYKTPPLGRVEDAHDIAMLFLEAIDRYMDTFWGEFYVGPRDAPLERESFGFRNQLEFGFDEKRRAFHLRGVRHPDANESKRDIVGSVQLTVVPRHVVRR